MTSETMTSGILLRLITDDQQSVNNEIPRGWYKLAQVREIGTARWYKYRYMYPKLCDLDNGGFMPKFTVAV